MNLFGRAIHSLEKALDVRLVKNSVLTTNLANVDTPGYVARDVDFEEAMASEYEPGILDDDQKEKIWAAEADSRGQGFDDNTVDLDRTMASLSANATQYGAVSRAAAKKLALLKYVAGDGA